MQTLKTETGLAEADESRWPLAFAGNMVEVAPYAGAKSEAAIFIYIYCVH